MLTYSMPKPWKPSTNSPKKTQLKPLMPKLLNGTTTPPITKKKPLKSNTDIKELNKEMLPTDSST